jgi:hypothetical protein
VQAPETSRDELKHAGARWIEPLHVVDRDDQRPLSGRERSNDRQGGARDGELVGAAIGGRLLQGDRERSALRLRQAGDRPRIDRLEDVRERRIRQSRLVLPRRSGEDGEALGAGSVEPGSPERRLADPGCTVDDEGTRSVIRRLDKAPDGRELRLPSDDRRSQPRSGPGAPQAPLDGL